MVRYKLFTNSFKISTMLNEHYQDVVHSVPSSLLYRYFSLRLQAYFALIDVLKKQKDNHSYTGMLIISYLINSLVHSSPGYSHLFQEVKILVANHRCLQNDLLFLPKLFQVTSTGRILCKVSVNNVQILAQNFPGYEPDNSFCPGGIAFALPDVVSEKMALYVDEEAFAGTKCGLDSNKPEIFANPVNKRKNAVYSYKLLFGDIFTVKYGLTAMGAVFFARALLDELAEFFFPIRNAREKLSSLDFSLDLYEPVMLAKLPDFEVVENIRSDVFRYLLPDMILKARKNRHPTWSDIDNVKRDRKLVTSLITFDSSVKTPWTDFVVRNCFLNLYQNESVPFKNLKEFSITVKQILNSYCRFFPVQKSTSTYKTSTKGKLQLYRII